MGRGKEWKIKNNIGFGLYSEDLVDKNLESYVLNEYKLGLDIIAATNVQYFSADMNAELYAMRGAFQVRLGQLEESNTSFSAAVQLSDKHVKAWAYWGEYLEQAFESRSTQNSSNQTDTTNN